MRRTATATVLALALGVGGLLALILLGSAFSAQAASCAPSGLLPAGSVPATAVTTGGPGARTSAEHLPDIIGGYKGEQVVNAAHIVVAAQQLGIGGRGQAVGVMTAIGESSLINVAHGDRVGPDSRGLFQQRDNGAWGSETDRMNPRIAASNFFQALLRVPEWESMPPTLAAHAVQRNADPFHYARFWAAAVQIVSVLGGEADLASKLPASGELSCSPGAGGAFTGPGGPFPAQACTVVPDPTTGLGCLTGRTLSLATQLKDQGWRLSCWDPHPQNPASDHPLGRACDVFPGRGGVLPTAAQKAAGDALAAALQASAQQTGVNYLIWYGRIWSLERADEGWRPYSGGGVYDPGAITGGHFDHVHVSLY